MRTKWALRLEDSRLLITFEPDLQALMPVAAAAASGACSDEDDREDVTEFAAVPSSCRSAVPSVCSPCGPAASPGVEESESEM